MHRTCFSALVCGVVLGLLATACGPSAAPSGSAPAAPAAPAASSAGAAATTFPPAVAQLVEGAKKETVLKGQWSSNSFGGSAGLQELVAGMNRKYGLNIESQFTPGRNMIQMMELIGQEAAAGQPASSDVYLGNGPAMLDEQKTGTLKPMDWQSVLDRPLPSEPGFDPVTPDKAGVAIADTVMGIVYNTNLVRGDDVPRKLEDVLLPKWKNKVVTTPYVAGFREYAMPDMLGREYVVGYVQRLSQQVSGLMRCGENERITSGEFAIFAISCSHNEIVQLQAKGAPIAHVIPEEGSILQVYYGGVPKNSSAPNAAALLIAYLHTPEGQATLYKNDTLDLYLYPEANTKKLVDEVRARGGKFVSTTPQWLGSSNFSEVQAELERIIQQGAR